MAATLSREEKAISLILVSEMGTAFHCMTDYTVVKSRVAVTFRSDICIFFYV